MKINLPNISTSRLINCMDNRNGFYETLYHNLRKYDLYDTLGCMDYYDMKNALIKAVNGIETAHHVIIIDENGYTTFYEYDTETVETLYNEWSSIIKADDNLVDVEGVTQDDLCANLYTVLYEDFGYDMYIEEYAINIAHGVEVETEEDARKLIYQYIEELYKDFKVKLKQLPNDEKLALWIAMNALGLIGEYRIEDLLILDFNCSNFKVPITSEYDIVMLALNDQSITGPTELGFLLHSFITAGKTYLEVIHSEA